MLENRLDRLDTWRAICCLGVLWIHCWHLNASDPIVIAGVNFAKLFSIVGNGVDFFFVISGFCIYYFYINKLKIINAKTYSRFIYSRFYRIIPAFFISIVVYAFLFKLDNGIINAVRLVLLNLFMLQNFSVDYEISSHFWSIAVEWHFYFMFPLLLYFRFKSNNIILYLSIITILISIVGVLLLKWDAKYDTQLPVRFVEFSMGIILAYYYRIKGSIEFNYRYIFLGILLLLMGRLFNTDFALHYFNSEWMYAIIKISGYAIMTAGFAILLYFTIDNKSTIFNFLTWKPLNFIGKISYSFYLWHSVSISIVWYYFHKLNLIYMLSPVLSVITQFLFCVAITIPIAYLSYHFIERKFKYNAKD